MEHLNHCRTNMLIREWAWKDCESDAGKAKNYDTDVFTGTIGNEKYNGKKYDGGDRYRKYRFPGNGRSYTCHYIYNC